MRKYESGDIVFINAELVPRYRSDWRLLRHMAIEQLVEDDEALVMAVAIGTHDVMDVKQRWHWRVLTSDLDVVVVREKHMRPTIEPSQAGEGDL
jgi:hypothetical protein